MLAVEYVALALLALVAEEYVPLAELAVEADEYDVGALVAEEYEIEVETAYVPLCVVTTL